jgi:hypothetical protein
MELAVATSSVDPAFTSPVVWSEGDFLQAFAISRETLLAWIEGGLPALRCEDGSFRINPVSALTFVARPQPASPYFTAKEAAAYLRISYSTFRKKATRIRRQPGTGRYHRSDLDEFAASLRPKRKR